MLEEGWLKLCFSSWRPFDRHPLCREVSLPSPIRFLAVFRRNSMTATRTRVQNAHSGLLFVRATTPPGMGLISVSRLVARLIGSSMLPSFATVSDICNNSGAECIGGAGF